ncbi:MAG: DedA family protein [Candidatus Pacebacteria bacterium]|nr:DedA family protein [Candidatus Paceibacterota bacterium]
MRKYWEWFQSRATSKHAEAWLAIMSFSESSFFLIPPDLLLIAILAAQAGRWVYYAFLTTISSVAGAVFGYVLGWYVFEPLVQPLIDLYGLTAEFAHVGALYEQSTFLSVFTAAFTPIPFKVFVLAGGFFKVPFIPFIIASIMGRGMRFFLVAWIAHRYGPRAAEFGLRYMDRILIGIVLCGVALFFAHSVWGIPW